MCKRSLQGNAENGYSIEEDLGLGNVAESFYCKML